MKRADPEGEADRASPSAAFSGGGPHLTTMGNTAVAKNIAAYFAAIQ